MYHLLSSSLWLFLLLGGSASFIALVCAAPVEEERNETNPMLTAGYFQGDMVLNAQQRNGVKNSYQIWPNNIVYYYIAPGYFNLYQRAEIDEGMRTIENNSCIRFKEASAHNYAYVHITGDPNGCYAEIGYQRRRQLYNLGNGCFKKGTILHEFLHTLGFYHMHTHPLRDHYIKINYQNIQPDNRKWFYIDQDVDDFGTGYDYYSIMHYRANAFSKHLDLKTIEPLHPNVNLSIEPDVMSQKDIYKLNMMYKCPYGL